MKVPTDILYLVLMVICFITAGAALLWIIMEWREIRMERRADMIRMLWK